MCPRLARLAIPLVVLLTGLQLAACNIPDRAEPEEPVQEAAEPTVEPVSEPVAEDPTAVVNQNANVRTGPSTDHAIAYWLGAGAVVTVVDRNAEGTWLRIEHEDRPGWIFAALTDIADEVAEGVAELPAEAPPAEPTPEPVVEPTPEPEPEPTPEAVEPTPAPTPEPTPEPETPPAAEPVPSPPAVTVTGSVVNLRTGPGTEHAINGQVRAGDELQATGRNAAGDWLLIVHPAATGEQVWIYAPLTDISAASLQVLAIVSAVAIGTPPTQESAVPTPEPTQEPAAARPPVMPPGCTRIHTVNPNEQRLQQITDWFGLDLQTTAVLNAIEPDAPLTAGWQLCLPEAPAVPPTVIEPAPQPAPAPSAAGGACRHPEGHAFPCHALADFPERGHPNAGIGPSVHTIYDVLWHAPGTYDRDLPGLDHEFELVFHDVSAQWDWAIRDFEGCYDALRVHMGDIPKEIGLTRLEFRLADPFAGLGQTYPPPSWVDSVVYHSPWGNPATVSWVEWPDWDPASLPPDLSQAAYGCHRGPWAQTVCDILPMWGNSHSIYLNAAVAQAMANIVKYMSSKALGEQYSRISSRVLEANSYLYPLDDRIGDPVGHGPCADVWHAQ